MFTITCGKIYFTHRASAAENATDATKKKTFEYADAWWMQFCQLVKVKLQHTCGQNLHFVI